MKRTPQLLAVVLALALLAATTSFLAVILVPRRTTFNVTAETERVEMRLTAPPPSRWTLDQVTVRQNDQVLQSNYAGDLELAAGTNVIIERIAMGPLHVYFECLSGCNSAGRLIPLDDGPRMPLPRSFELEVTDPAERASEGRTIILPLSGAVSAGRTIGIETGTSTATLRAGRVAMLGRSVFRNSVFEAGSLTLETGDQFVVQGESVGFAVVDERAAMRAVYRVIANSGEVMRPGGGGYRTSASTLGQLFNDELFRAVSALLAFAGGLISIFGFIEKVGPPVITRWTGPPSSPHATVTAPIDPIPTPGGILPTPPSSPPASRPIASPSVTPELSNDTHVS